MRKAHWIGIALLVAGTIGAIASVSLFRGGDVPPIQTSGFPGPRTASGLDPTKWEETRDGDFEEGSVTTMDRDGRIRIRAATRGTRPETVKFIGARSLRKFPLEKGAQVSARLDWNAQTNGSYLSAALILSPEASRTNPLSGSDWLKVEYIGVPPGENARMHVACRTGGQERFLYTEGWPDVQRTGRKIALQEIEIVFTNGSFTILENKAVMFQSKEKLVGFDAAHLYLQMSTHSNYPSREVLFDQVSIPGGL